MVQRVIDRKTAVDLIVNLIPMGMLVFFIGLFISISPWEWDPIAFVIAHGLLLVPLFFLALVTYVSGRAIARDERRAGGEQSTDTGATDTTNASGASNEYKPDPQMTNPNAGEADEAVAERQAETESTDRELASTSDEPVQGGGSDGEDSVADTDTDTDEPPASEERETKTADETGGNDVNDPADDEIDRQ